MKSPLHRSVRGGHLAAFLLVAALRRSCSRRRSSPTCRVGGVLAVSAECGRLTCRSCSFPWCRSGRPRPPCGAPYPTLDGSRSRLRSRRWCGFLRGPLRRVSGSARDVSDGSTTPMHPHAASQRHGVRCGPPCEPKRVLEQNPPTAGLDRSWFERRLGVAVAGQGRSEPRPSDQTAPASQGLARPIIVVPSQPSIDLSISLVAGNAVALLDAPSELITATSCLVEVIVSDISPLLLSLSLELLLVPLDTVPVHR